MYQYLDGPISSKSHHVATRGWGGGRHIRGHARGGGSSSTNRRGQETVGGEDHHKVRNYYTLMGRDTSLGWVFDHYETK